MINPSETDSDTRRCAVCRDTPSFWALGRGRWAFCNGFNDYLGRTGGLELVRGDDNKATYYLLYPDTSGTELIRGTGPQDSGGLFLDFYNDSTNVGFQTADGDLTTYLDFYSGENDMVLGGYGTGGGPRFVRIE